MLRRSYPELHGWATRRKAPSTRRFGYIAGEPGASPVQRLPIAIAFAASSVSGAGAAEVKILTAGAMKAVVLELVPQFEKETGHKAVVDNDTAGGLAKRIEGGEAFDVAVITPSALNDLTKKGKIVPDSRTNVARVGVGVVVRDGAPLPDISTVDGFKRALLAAKSVAYID